MFPSASSPKGTLARYVPQNHETQNLEATSFRFGEEESLKGVWKVIRKRKRMIGLGGLAGMLLAFLVCLIMHNQYAAVTTVIVGKTDASQTSLLRNGADGSPSADEMKTDIATHSAMLQSENIVLSVVKDLNLRQEAPFAYEPTLLGALNGANAHMRAEKGLPLDQSPNTRDRILKIFAKKLKVENTPDTRMITVTYLHPNAQRAADISNALVREYVSFQARAQSTADAQEW